jgi:hypothetical protein
VFYSGIFLQSQVAGSKIVYVHEHEHEHVYGRTTELKPGPEGQVLAVIIKKWRFAVLITHYSNA